MKTSVKPTTVQILRVMHILAWIAFIGLLVKAGAILTSFAVSLVNPEAARDLYTGLNLYKLRQFDVWYYSASVSLLFGFVGLKAYVLYLVVRALSRIKLASPFVPEVAQLVEKISYVLISLWGLALLYNAQAAWLLKRTGIPQGEWSLEGYFFLAGLVFIISQLFKRGVELQAEHELTI